MARGRMLSKDASTDTTLNSVSMHAQLLYMLTLPHLDRDGLIDGRPTLLWAQAAPCRLELLDQSPRLVQEWIDAGLVDRYEWRDGPILFFHGFRKHNSGLEYAKEPASKYPPPPGYRRDKEGLIPNDEESCFRLAEHFSPRNAYAQALTAHGTAVRENIENTSRTLPEVIGETSSLREEKRTTNIREEKENNNNREETPAAAAAFSESENAQDWALEKMAKLTWSGRAKYYESLSNADRDLLIAWLYHHQQCTDRYSPHTGPNPFATIHNVPGFIKWSIEEGNTPDLTAAETGDLAAILSGDSISGETEDDYYDRIINR